MKNYVFSALNVAFCTLMVSSAYADNVTDLYFQEASQRYFEYQQNARTFGMAGSSVQSSTDSSNVVGNPAGLGFQRNNEFSTTYSYNRISGDEFPTNADIDQTENIGSGIITLPIMPVLGDVPEYGNFGVAWSQSKAKWNDDSFNTIAERTQLVSAWGYALSPVFSLGYSLGWTSDKFQSRDVFDYPMGDGFRHTAGLSWKPQNDAVIGASFFIGHGSHNALYGPGIKGDSDTQEVGVDVGWQLQLENTLVAMGVDYRHLSTNGQVVQSIPANVVGGDENGNLYNIRLGLENKIDDSWKVRAGYRFAGLASYKYERVELNPINGSAYYNAYTLGAGYSIPIHDSHIKAVNLDYGVEYRDIAEGDWQHVVTVSVPFNTCG